MSASYGVQGVRGPHTPAWGRERHECACDRQRRASDGDGMVWTSRRGRPG
ncbi:hypothetical protein ABZ330_26145 [Streptomyces sp. NPDC006172]